MPLKVCDDTFYWFITLRLDETELEETQEIRESLGLNKLTPTINLWPCRLCGAMVHGGLRSDHRKFHAGIKDEL